MWNNDIRLTRMKYTTLETTPEMKRPLQLKGYKYPVTFEYDKYVCKVPLQIGGQSCTRKSESFLSYATPYTHLRNVQRYDRLRIIAEQTGNRL